MNDSWEYTMSAVSIHSLTKVFISLHAEFLLIANRLQLKSRHCLVSSSFHSFYLVKYLSLHIVSQPKLKAMRFLSSASCFILFFSLAIQQRKTISCFSLSYVASSTWKRLRTAPSFLPQPHIMLKTLRSSIYLRFLISSAAFFHTSELFVYVLCFHINPYGFCKHKQMSFFCKHVFLFFQLSVWTISTLG